MCIRDRVTVDPAYNQKLMDVNVGGTENIIDQCLKHKECRKLVYVSSTGAIPELPKGQKIKEVYQFTPIDEKKQVGCYSQSKAIATQAVLDAVNERGLNACIVHPSGILGPKDYAVGQTTGVIIQIKMCIRDSVKSSPERRTCTRRPGHHVICRPACP